MRHDSIGRVILLTLGVMLTALLPGRGQEDAELPSDATVQPSQTIPIMYITTADGKPIITKKEYKRATFYISDPAGNMSLGTAAEPLGMNIRGKATPRGRGTRSPISSSWTRNSHSWVCQRISTGRY